MKAGLLTLVSAAAVVNAVAIDPRQFEGRPSRPGERPTTTRPAAPSWYTGRDPDWPPWLTIGIPPIGIPPIITIIPGPQPTNPGLPGGPSQCGVDVFSGHTSEASVFCTGFLGGGVTTLTTTQTIRGTTTTRVTYWTTLAPPTSTPAPPPPPSSRAPVPPSSAPPVGPIPSFGPVPSFGPYPSFGPQPPNPFPSFGSQPSINPFPSFGSQPSFGPYPSFGPRPTNNPFPSFGPQPSFGPYPSFPGNPPPAPSSSTIQSSAAPPPPPTSSAAPPPPPPVSSSTRVSTPTPTPTPIAPSSTLVTVSSVAAPSPSASSGCGLVGYTKSTSAFYFDSSGTKNTFAACKAACTADSTCKSFGYGEANCMLFNVLAPDNVSYNPMSPYTFYNADCPTELPVLRRDNLTAAQAITVTGPGDVSSACSCLITSAPGLSTARVTVTDSSIRVTRTITQTITVTPLGKN